MYLIITETISDDPPRKIAVGVIFDRRSKFKKKSHSVAHEIYLNLIPYHKYILHLSEHTS